jgi:rubrerythrin
MSETTEHREGSGASRLRDSKTIGEILETATAFEKAARDFYAGLGHRVSKPLRELTRELAEEEQRHYELFKALAAREDVLAYVGERIRTPSSDPRFCDYVHLPELGDMPDDQSILQYAMGREQAAMEQYGELARETPEGPLRDLFQFLAQEELAHKGELEKRYYELVYTR